MGLKSALADLAASPSPRTVLTKDRAAFWTFVLVGVLAVVLIWVGVGVAATFGHVGLVIDFSRMLVFGPLSGLAFGSAIGLRKAAWVSFVMARGWLALRGRLPWRLMAFLADAHEHRGVLRQAGAAYQFRHVDLQRRLAARR